MSECGDRDCGGVIRFGRAFPFDPRRKSGAAAADQSCRLYFREHRLRRHRQCFFKPGIAAARLILGKRCGTTFAAVAGEDADISADNAGACASGICRTDGSGLRGMGGRYRSFAGEQRRRAVAQTEARSMLDGKFTVRADFTAFSFQMTAQGFD